MLVIMPGPLSTEDTHELADNGVRPINTSALLPWSMEGCLVDALDVFRAIGAQDPAHQDCDHRVCRKE
jgi:hypothetical protein